MRNHTSVLPFNEDRVLMLSEFAIMAGISLVTLRRLIARGEGPAVTKLSTRRLGVRVSHARAWLNFEEHLQALRPLRSIPLAQTRALDRCHEDARDSDDR